MLDEIDSVVTVVAVTMSIVALAGLSMAAYGAVLWRRNRALLATGQRTSGVVVDNQVESRTDQSLVFRPVVRFRTGTGEEITVVANRPSHRSFVAGTSLPIVYDPADPASADLATGGAGRPYLISGLVFAVFAVVVYLVFSSFADAASTTPTW
jgi:hypothetical protein